MGVEAEALRGFEDKIGYRFKHRDYLVLALTHRSFVFQEGMDRGHSNERLEFLGDSVLGLLINEALIRDYPEEDEGRLTKMKSLLVSRVVLAQVARALELGELLRLSGNEQESGGRGRESILADALEALLGAIFLDGGLQHARHLVASTLLSRRDEFLSDDSTRNYKSILQEKVQSYYKAPPRYRVGGTFGPDHSKDFLVEVLIQGEVMGTGRGRSKKDAEQEAARTAYDVFMQSVMDDPQEGS